jgi:hypothetical protein
MQADMPTQSDYMPDITSYFLMAISLNMISFIWFIYHNRCLSRTDMPSWLEKFGELVKKMFCLCFPSDKKDSAKVANLDFEVSNGTKTNITEITEKKIKTEEKEMAHIDNLVSYRNETNLTEKEIKSEEKKIAKSDDLIAHRIDKELALIDNLVSDRTEKNINEKTEEIKTEKKKIPNIDDGIDQEILDFAIPVSDGNQKRKKKKKKVKTEMIEKEDKTEGKVIANIDFVVYDDTKTNTIELAEKVSKTKGKESTITEMTDKDSKTEDKKSKCKFCNRCGDCEADFKKDKDKGKRKKELESILQALNWFAFLIILICMIAGNLGIWLNLQK